MWDSHDARDLVCNDMTKPPPNLADLSPDVQALFAAQAAELARKDAEILGLSLSHRAAQKRLEAEATSMNAALAAERTAHAQAIPQGPQARREADHPQ